MVGGGRSQIVNAQEIRLASAKPNIKGRIDLSIVYKTGVPIICTSLTDATILTDATTSRPVIRLSRGAEQFNGNE
jgi:hypothetical protein